MKTLINIALLTFSLIFTAAAARADNDYWYRGDQAPDIEVWTNKGNNSTYYYGEDVAVYFRTDQDCYVVVYDIDPSGEVNVLFPNSLSGSSYANGDQVYRIPDYNDDYRIEVSGSSGREHIFAVASFDYINPPDFMKYIGYDYGDDDNYSGDYFVIKARGEFGNFVANINARITNGSYNVAHALFNVDTAYRHHEHYRYWDYDPYNVGSIWVGSDWPGSEIWIDGVFYGIAPVFIPRVIVGYHWVWVYYGGYPCYQRNFYVTGDKRFYIDVRIDNRYRDHRYRRHAFGGWVFEQKKYRNEDGFRERARRDHDKSIRTRSLPPSVIRDYADRGIIRKDAPIAKDIRTRPRARDTRPGAIAKPERTRPTTGIEKPDRTRDINRGRDDNSDRVIRERKPENSDRQKRDIDDNPKVIIPETHRKPERIAPSDQQRDDKQERKIERRHNDSDNSDQPKVEKKRETKSDSNSSRQEKATKSERGRDSGSKDKPSKSGKAAEGKERGR